MSFRDELSTLINKHSKENGSNTPDFILAEYLTKTLAVFDETVATRERWYGRGVEDATEPKPKECKHGRSGYCPDCMEEILSCPDCMEEIEE
jgi:hypothetical protein